MNENSAILLGRFLFLDFYYSVSPIAQGGTGDFWRGNKKSAKKICTGVKIALPLHRISMAHPCYEM